jgi:hypothetical protein
MIDVAVLVALALFVIGLVAGYVAGSSQKRSDGGLW